MDTSREAISKDIPLYNSRIVDNYIKLLNYKYPWVNANEILRYAGMTSYEVADQGHWFTQRQIDRFHQRLSQQTKNDNISREAGRYFRITGCNGRHASICLGDDRARQIL